MSLRCLHLRQISGLLRRFPSGYNYKLSRLLINSEASSLSSLPRECNEMNTAFSRRFSVPFRHSATPQPSQEPPSKIHLLSFIESVFDQPQGPHHCWLNRVEGKRDSLKKDRILLVVSGRLFDKLEKVGRDSTLIFEKGKLLQQRFPSLFVIGFQDSSSLCFADDLDQLVQLLMKEYITFPILLSKKYFSQLTDGACYILSKDFKDPLVYHEKDLDLSMLDKAIEELSLQQKVHSISPLNLKSSWSKEVDIIKEPHFGTALQNLLLHFPACICADQSGERLFLSDCNHHRIIIFDGDGKILDCIGYCPGFEDGEFESAKLLRPAASFYHAYEDCLYIVDSENQAIRRADLERRVLETVYPVSSVNKKSTSLWTWIKNKLGFGGTADVKNEDSGSQTLISPWHLIKCEDTSCFIISRSFETLWVMNFASGEIQEVVKGFPNTLERCRHVIMEKLSLVKMMPDYFLQQHSNLDLSLEELLYADLISCVTTFQNYIVMCDTVGQGVLKLNRESGICSPFQFSNLWMLGLPYWLSLPLERFYAVAQGLSAGQIDHTQKYSLLPGKVDIRLSIDIPADTELVEPLHESCIWCQARGAATEFSALEGVAGSSEKVGVAQQWYDELDNLAFSTPEPESVMEDENVTADTNSEDERIHIDCAVNTSPGTSEVIIYAALYLKLRSSHVLGDENQEKLAARIVDILKPERNGVCGDHSCIKLLQKSNRDLRDLVFIKPLHVRIQFDCPDHQKADNSKSIILINSSINVDVCLKA